MKIAVVGLGAVGGLIAARLARAGHEVSALARGETLARVRADGLHVESARGSFSAPREGERRRRDARPAGARRHRRQGAGAAVVADAIAPLLGPTTVVLPAMNGVPWWFLPAADAPAQAPLASVDPGGAPARAGCRSSASSAASSTSLRRARRPGACATASASG